MKQFYSRLLLNNLRLTLYFFSSGKYIIAKVKSDFDQITQGIRVNVYKVIVAQLVENFPSSYGTRSFMTFSFLTQIHPISYLPLYSFPVYLSIILISSYLFPSGFTSKSCSLSFLRAALSAHQSRLFGYSNRVWHGLQP